MEDILCNITISKEENDFYIARIKSDFGGNREFKSKNIEEVIEQMTVELQEEFEE